MRRLWLLLFLLFARCLPAQTVLSTDTPFIPAGSPTTTITVYGNAISSGTVLFNGATLTTNPVYIARPLGSQPPVVQSTGALQATIPYTMLASPGVAAVTVSGTQGTANLRNRRTAGAGHFGWTSDILDTRSKSRAYGLRRAIHSWLLNRLGLEHYFVNVRVRAGTSGHYFCVLRHRRAAFDKSCLPAPDVVWATGSRPESADAYYGRSVASICRVRQSG